jgi:hypothetical protein
MATAAGKVDVILSVNATQYSKQLDEAQRQLDQLKNKANAAGHGTVSSMQAASASIRLLENPLGNNIRAIERLISQSQLLSGVMKAAFPVVGLVAGGMILGRLIGDVVKFVQTANQMPKAIQQGFASLNLSSKTSIDQLQLINDGLDNAHAKFEHKPQNNQKIAIDEARIAMDKFAESIESSNSKLGELLSKNHLSAWHELMFTASTSDREGTAKYFQNQLNDNAYDLANAAPGSPEEATAKRATIATLQAQVAEARRDLVKQQNVGGANGGEASKNTQANQAIDKGIITDRLNLIKSMGEQEANATKEAQAKLDEAAKQAAAEIKAAAQKRLDAMDKELAAEKQKGDESIGQTYIYWLQRTSAFAKGSEQYQAVQDKVREARHSLQATFAEGIKRNSIENTEGADILSRANAGIQTDNTKSANETSQGYIDSNQTAIDTAHNDAKQKEAQLTDSAGRSITRYAAALEIANEHVKEYITVQMSLQAILDTRMAAQTANPSAENARAVTAAQAALANAQSQRNIQVQSDSDAVNGRSSSAGVGFADALNEFVQASRDAATQMRDLTTNTLQGLNQQIVAAMSGQRTNFKGFGAGVFRSVADTGLQKVEGSALSALGFGGGKLGTQSNPMYVRMADAVGSAVGSVGGLLGKMFRGGGSTSSSSGGGSASGDFLDMLSGVVPFLAGGGPINGPAVVGENGPELFNPGTSGTIIPNHKLSTMSGGGGHTINIDASGSTDPAQTHAAVMRGIYAAAPHLINASVNSVKDDRRRRSSFSR